MTTNFSMVAGDGKQLEVSVIDENGAAYDLTGYTARWGLGRLYGPKLFELPATIENPSAGLLVVTLVPSNTAGLEGAFWHEAEIIDSGGAPSTVLQGIVTISRGLL